jgi:hypothetical protein
MYPPGCAGAREGDSESGMRTTGSKVDILLRLVRLVIDGLFDVVVVRRLLDFGDGDFSVRAWLGRCAKPRTGRIGFNEWCSLRLSQPYELFLSACKRSGGLKSPVKSILLMMFL